MEIKIETASVPLVFDLKQSAPDGVVVEFPPPKLRRSVDYQDLILATVTVALSVPTNLLSSWLFEKLKDQKRTKATVGNQEISGDEAEIRRVLKEQMERENAGQRDYETNG